MKLRLGITLVELLVVMAILVVLAGLLFPVFRQAKSAAGDTACLSNLHQIHVAIELYKNDNGSYPWITTDHPVMQRYLGGKVPTCRKGYHAKGTTMDYSITAALDPARVKPRAEDIPEGVAFTWITDEAFASCQEARNTDFPVVMDRNHSFRPDVPWDRRIILVRMSGAAVNVKDDISKRYYRGEKLPCDISLGDLNL
jgi:type II secretory pathway pseudopilin PulG